MPTPYSPPGITLTTLGAQTPILTGPAAKTIMLLGTAPKGPDYPVVVTAGQVAALFGDPGNIGSVGYSIPYLFNFAAQQQAPNGGGAIQFLVCRAGVARGTYLVLDGAAGTTMTLKGIGAYAGSAAQYLQVTITVATGKVTSISFTDSRTSLPVGTGLADVSIGGPYDLSSNAKIVAAINATNPLSSIGSVVIATLGASSVVPAIVTNAAFTAGTDGKAAAYNDATIGTNGSGGLLDQSLYVPADYIVAGYDAALIGPTLLAHMNTAAGQNNFRKAWLGPIKGTSFASLSAGTYLGGSLQNSRLNVVGHDSASAIHPATGAYDGFDGYTAAAGVAGLMASGPTQETAINFPVSGVASLNIPPDKTGQLSATDLNALGSVGLSTLQQNQQTGALTVRDTLTTAPATINGTNQVNQYAFSNIQAIDDAVSTAVVQALQPFRGRPMSTAAETSGQMLAAVQGAIGGLGPVTNGINTDGTSFVQDPATGNITGKVSYITRMGIRNIPISTGFTS